jgi:hypothetical protein
VPAQDVHDLEGELDLGGEIGHEELAEFADEAEPEPLDAEAVQLGGVLDELVQVLEAVVGLDLGHLPVDLLLTLAVVLSVLHLAFGLVDEVVDVDVGAVGEVVVDVDEDFFLGLHLLVGLVDVLEVDVGEAHQLGLHFGVVDVLHTDRGGGRLPVFLQVDDQRPVLFLLLRMFVLYVSVHRRQRAVHLPAVAAELLAAALALLLLLPLLLLLLSRPLALFLRRHSLILIWPQEEILISISLSQSLSELRGRSMVLVA